MEEKIKFNKRRFILRIFGLPFVMGLNLVFLIYVFIIQTYRFMMFGGEFLTMSKSINKDTISDILNVLIDMKERNLLK